MKLDTKYTSIDICPVTGDMMSESDVYNTDGVCPYCGDVSSFVTHHIQVPGRWNRPSWWENAFLGKEPEFLRKEDEDKVMNALKGKL